MLISLSPFTSGRSSKGGGRSPCICRHTSEVGRPQALSSTRSSGSNTEELGRRRHLGKRTPCPPACRGQAAQPRGKARAEPRAGTIGIGPLAGQQRAPARFLDETETDVLAYMTRQSTVPSCIPPIRSSGSMARSSGALKWSASSPTTMPPSRWRSHTRAKRRVGVTRRYMSLETVAQVCDDQTIDVVRIAAL